MAYPRVYVISGGMGESGDQLARTALAQFPDVDAPIEIVRMVHSRADVAGAVDQAARGGGFIIHTLVDPELRDYLIGLAADRQVPAFDSIGPVLDNIASLFHDRPLGVPGLYRKLHEDYFRRVEAIEFAVGHDDGQRFAELHLSDVVLIGPSRVGKTPLSMYLAMRGFKVANVPLVRGIDPPEELFEIERGRVVGLSIEPGRLQAFRRQRQANLGPSAPTSYSQSREVFEDLEYARSIFRKGRFGVVDVTDKPIEESANDVVALVTRSAGPG
jgi:hypothetical protein